MLINCVLYVFVQKLFNFISKATMVFQEVDFNNGTSVKVSYRQWANYTSVTQAANNNNINFKN